MSEQRPVEVFRGYAKFYDSLYQDKDYAAEVRFVDDLFAAHGVKSGGTVLDLGCGTGGHVIPLALAGHSVTGVDRSQEMLDIARGKAAQAGAELTFELGDVCSIDLGTTFDAVISMFAVVGYQLSNEDLAAMLAVARAHLAPGGLFIFDAWFGPAVLSERPEVKRKPITLADGTELIRIATPTLDVVKQTVRVDYELVRADGTQDPEPEVAESHEMRFLFAQEVAYFLEVAGFEVVDFMPFMEPGRTPNERDWNVSWVARAV